MAENFLPFYQRVFGSAHPFNQDAAAFNSSDGSNWPPYDMIRVSPDGFQLIFAVPGFSTQELSISFQPNLLRVAGAKAGENKGQYLYRGITEAPFTRQFELPNYVEVRNASLEKGLLKIDLVREIPEPALPRKIEIAPIPAESGGSPVEEAESVDNYKAAA